MVTNQVLVLLFFKTKVLVLLVLLIGSIIKFESRETTLYLTEAGHPLILGKAPSTKKLYYKPIDSVLLSALSSFLVQLL